MRLRRKKGQPKSPCVRASTGFLVHYGPVARRGVREFEGRLCDNYVCENCTGTLFAVNIDEALMHAGVDPLTLVRDITSQRP